MKLIDIGIYGLGVIGQGLALNLSDKGFGVAVYNRTTEGEECVTEEYINSRCKGKLIVGTHNPEQFVNKLRRPRKILIMVKSGAPVDTVINQLLPYLERGDIIIDGGNSHYLDTTRRIERLESLGIHYIGCGISGGVEGALNGPSLMPGGSISAWNEVREMFQSIAAHTDDGAPCCEWIGTGGSGHFVKMVHNGIEYALMQMIAEVFDVMQRALNLDIDQIADVFSQWNETGLQSYLLGITVAILKTRDEDGKPLIHNIRDRAGHKGTGLDASIAALKLGLPATVMAEAVCARLLSGMVNERQICAEKFFRSDHPFPDELQVLLNSLCDSLYCSQQIAYAQGFILLADASAEYKWDLDLHSIARIWRKGCIIRSGMLNETASTLKLTDSKDAVSILCSDSILSRLTNWRNAVATAIINGVPVPCLSSAISFFDSLRSKRLPTCLIQCQRDFFGHHGVEKLALNNVEFNIKWESY